MRATWWRCSRMWREPPRLLVVEVHAHLRQVHAVVGAGVEVGAVRAAPDDLGHEEVRAAAGDTVTSFEMIPANAVEMVRADTPSLRDPNPSAAPWRVLCEISMAREDQAREALETSLETAIEAGLASDAVIAENLGQARDFWAIREAIPLSKRAYGTSVNHDVSVPVSAIPDFLDATEARLASLVPGVEIVAFGHVGDGNLHYSACEPVSDARAGLAAQADAITETVHACAMEHSGSISAEHGVGRLKRDELAAIRPAAATATMRAIKQALDPDGIMNPGRVVSARSEAS